MIDNKTRFGAVCVLAGLVVYVVLLLYMLLQVVPELIARAQFLSREDVAISVSLVLGSLFLFIGTVFVLGDR
jgi:uncharacterized membrane protein YqhA